MAEMCNTCNEARNNVVAETAERVITLDMSAPLIWGTGKLLKEERRNLLNCFMKHICALRNAGGGILLVHFVNKRHENPDLNAFSEMVDVRLNSMIEDDTLFVDNYERDWLETYKDVLIFKVKSSSTCSTADFKTKIPLDSCLVDPTARSIPRLYSLPADEKIQGPIVHGVDWTHEMVPLYESRSVQLKRYVDGLSIPESMQDTADTIWDKLKLKENITAMTKILGGGLYFCGIEEVRCEIDEENYHFNKSKVHGMILMGNRRIQLKDILLKKVEDDMLWTTPRNEVIPAPRDIVKIVFHEVRTDVYVMEVKIGWFEGLVYYDKQGPECYEIQDGEGTSEWRIKRVEYATWISRVRPDLHMD